MDATSKPKDSMFGFSIVVMANLISGLGTQMTRFALIAWAWQLTGSATASGLVAVASWGANVVASAFAGVLVDRWNRKLTIILSDIVGALSTIFVLAMYGSGGLQVWHLALMGAVAGIVDSFQFPAYMSSISTMVPAKHYGRANGMFQFAWTLSFTAAPVLGALLLKQIDMLGIMIVDLATFAVVVGAILFVRIPQPEPSGEAQPVSIWSDITTGFKYIFQRKSLLGLLLVLMGANVACGAYEGVFRPMVLALTGDDLDMLGKALTYGGIGGVVGGALMMFWGGPKSKMPSLLLGLGLMSGAGLSLMAVGRSLLIWSVGGFAYGFFLALVNTLMFSLWHMKVEPAVQGRVFNSMRLIVLASTPFAIFGFSFLADFVAEPAMRGGGAVARLFGDLVGTAPGSGMSLILFLAGVFGVLVAIIGFVARSVREAQSLLPDHSEAA